MQNILFRILKLTRKIEQRMRSFRACVSLLEIRIRIVHRKATRRTTPKLLKCKSSSPSTFFFFFLSQNRRRISFFGFISVSFDSFHSAIYAVKPRLTTSGYVVSIKHLANVGSFSLEKTLIKITSHDVSLTTRRQRPRSGMVVSRKGSHGSRTIFLLNKVGYLVSYVLMNIC